MRAPFSDLEVGERLAGEAQLGHLRLDPRLGHALPHVHAGELRRRVGIALRVAAGDDDLAVVAVRLELDGAADFGLGLFARGGDERAGVDDDDVGAVGIG